MKVLGFDADITPAVGTEVAGYGPHDVSEACHDPLMCNAIIMDDGSKKALLLAYDLLGLDRPFVQRIRRECAAVLGCGEMDVILTCSHTHEGPHTRSNAGHPTANMEYVEFLVNKTVEALKEALKKEYRECDVYYYSSHVKVNYNRRYCGPENVCRFLPEWRMLEPLADGICDDEVGMIFFTDPGKRRSREIIVNFAAHPLTAHAPGLGGLTISADYPAVVRQLVKEATGAHTIFTTGAAGDMFTLHSEMGPTAAYDDAKQIAYEVIRCATDAPHHKELFLQKDAKIQTSFVSYKEKIRTLGGSDRTMPCFADKSEVDVDLQFLALGDVCFVGVPCELLAEPGLEIKWHSPFRKAFILYNSTDYLSYFCHANAFVAGGYEANCCPLDFRTSLHLVNAAVDEMFRMHGPIEVPGRK